ncbi:MAG: Spx/MgsR family RNA polymerase-binding regulatory protein [Leadbetterella sp.]|jgi:arsenate reductase (glutaredoxin)|nr:Spx/MgsR family RNA polymerase-binding regulatory protein [Leadbetterella sp.]
MLTVYGIPNCDTVKKALDFLKNRGEEFTFHNYKTDGISRDKLEEWLQQVPLDKIVNKRSTTFKDLGQAEKDALDTPLSAFEVIMQHTSVIKRPIIEDQKIVAVGFDKVLYEQLF